MPGTARSRRTTSRPRCSSKAMASPAIAQIVERARHLAVQQRKPVAGTDHLLAALLEQDSLATRTLGSAGIAAAGVEAASAGVPLPPTLAARHAGLSTNTTKDPSS